MLYRRCHDPAEHQTRPRRTGDGQRYRRGEPAHLQFVHLCLRIGRVYATLGLCAQRQSHARFPGTADRPARTRCARFRLRLRARGDPCSAVDLRTGRAHCGRLEHLRRHLLAVQRAFQPLGARQLPGGHTGPARAGACDRRTRRAGPGEGGLFRDAHEPVAAGQRRARHRRDRAQVRRHRDRRQHLRHAIPAAAARSGRRHRDSFRHEIPRRPFRRRRRSRGGGQRHSRSPRVLLAEQTRRRARPRGMRCGAPWDPDARTAPRTPAGECARRCAPSR